MKATRCLLVWLVIAALSLSCSDEQSPQTPLSSGDPSNEGQPEVTRGTEHWNWHQIPFSEELYAIAGSEQGYNIGGSSGVTKFSSDGRTWFTGSWNGSVDYLSVTSLGDVYVAVGTGPYCSIRSNTTGGNAMTGQLETLRAVTWSGFEAVAVGNAGELVTTPDGRNWQRHTPITEADLYAITWAGDRFVCGGENGVIYRSINGVDWSAQESPIKSTITGLAQTVSGLYAVTEAGGVWRKFAKSWKRKYSDERSALRGITGFGEMVIAVGDDACLVEKNRSGDWKRWSLDIDSDFRAVTAYDRIAVVGSNRLLMVSSDGLSWEERPAFPPHDLYGMSSNGNTLVAVGEHGIIRSTDGSDWQQTRYVKYEGIYTVLWAGDHYLACGKDGLVLTSPDGTDWQQRNSPRNDDLWSTHWTGSKILIGGDGGKLLVTTDYVDWEEISFPSSGAIFGFAQSPAKLVAVTTDGKACVSTDGRSWTATHSGARFDGVVWTGSSFVGLRNSSVSRSPDGTNWRSFKIAGVQGLRGIGFWNNRVYVTSYRGKILWSENLVNWYSEESGFEWTEYNLNTSLSLNAFEVCGDEAFIVGDGGVILQWR